MVNIKLPDTFNEVDFKKDYLNNVKPCDLMTKYNICLKLKYMAILTVII